MAAPLHFDLDEEITKPDIVPVPNPHVVSNNERRKNRRRGRGIHVHWFYGERRNDDRRRKTDRRGRLRAAVCVEVEETVGRWVFYRYTSDMSSTGLSVPHASPHSRGTTVLLKFTLPDEQEGEQIRCLATVLGPYRGHEGMRYHFLWLTANDAKRLDRFLEQQIKPAK